MGREQGEVLERRRMALLLTSQQEIHRKWQLNGIQTHLMSGMF